MRTRDERLLRIVHPPRIPETPGGQIHDQPQRADSPHEKPLRARTFVLITREIWYAKERENARRRDQEIVRALPRAQGSARFSLLGMATLLGVSVGHLSRSDGNAAQGCVFAGRY